MIVHSWIFEQPTLGEMLRTGQFRLTSDCLSSCIEKYHQHYGDEVGYNHKPFVKAVKMSRSAVRI